MMHVDHIVYCLESERRGRNEDNFITEIGKLVANAFVRNIKLRFLWYNAVLSSDVEEDQHFDARSSFTIMSYLSIHFVTAFCYDDILNNLTVIFTMPRVYQYSVRSETLQVLTELQ